MIANFSDHAANERTFLAWVRTAMALVGFGLALSRLGKKPPDTTTEVVLVVLGLIVVLISYVRMHVLLKRIESGSAIPYASGLMGGLLAVSIISLLALVVVFGLHLL